jgi:N-acetylglutamate synthase-like GNAT family acetyltransferase
MNPNDTTILHHPNPEEKRPFDGEIRDLREEDVEQLKPIIAHWHIGNFKKDMEPEDYLEHVYAQLIESTKRDTGKRYFVATDKEGKVIGVMGMTKPSGSLIMPFVTSENCTELINAFVDPNTKLTGVGKSLLNKIEEEAILSGAEEMIVSSGEIFKLKGWKFWTRNFGEPVHVYEDYWGVPNSDVVVWRKKI